MNAGGEIIRENLTFTNRLLLHDSPKCNLIWLILVDLLLLSLPDLA